MKAVGIISIIYGSLAILWSLSSLMVVTLFSKFIGFIPEFDQSMIPFDFDTYLHSIFDLIYIVMPIALIVGGIYLWGGINVVRKISGSFQLRLAAILNIVWYIIYIYLFVTRVFPQLMGIFAGFEELRYMDNIFYIVFIFSFIMGAIFYCGYAVFLLIYLRNRTED